MSEIRKNLSLCSMITWPIVSSLGTIYLFVLMSRLYDNFFPYVISFSPAIFITFMQIAFTVSIVLVLLIAFKVFTKFEKIVYAVSCCSTSGVFILMVIYCSLYGTDQYRNFAISETITFTTNYPLNSKTVWLNVNLGIEKNTTDSKIKINNYISQRTFNSGIYIAVFMILWFSIQGYVLYKVRITKEKLDESIVGDLSTNAEESI